MNLTTLSTTEIALIIALVVVLVARRRVFVAPKAPDRKTAHSIRWR